MRCARRNRRHRMPCAPEGRRSSEASRSPRGREHHDEDGEAEDPDMPEWAGNGPSPVERKFMGQLGNQRAFLEQVLNPGQPPKGWQQQPPPREMAAGVPLDAAQALLLLGPEPDGVPCWRGAPAEVACIAAALRLFGRLMPGKLDEQACGRFVAKEGQACGAPQPSRESRAIAESLESAASSWGLDARRVPTAAESLKAMVKNRPTVCCVVLEAYVGVLEDPETGEELEQEVGSHCLMVIGGDLLGPSFVTFDPFGLRGGEVSFWSGHSVKAAAPAVWIELSPQIA